MPDLTPATLARMRAEVAASHQVILGRDVALALIGAAEERDQITAAVDRWIADPCAAHRARLIGLRKAEDTRSTRRIEDALPELSVRAGNCLTETRRWATSTGEWKRLPPPEMIADLAGYTASDLLHVRGLGRRTLNEIVEWLAEMGIALKQEDDLDY